MTHARLILIGLLIAAVSRAAQPPFTFLPPGDLAPGSGDGRKDQTNYAPDMRFPLEAMPAFANSQVWNPGGQHGKGSQCTASNYSYPWRDNYCETRSWPISLCPTGQGHQGQDIRAASCANDTHWAVAALDGKVTNIGNYSLYVLTSDGNTRFDYLHMSSIAVGVGDAVKPGTRLGKVSNVFNGTPTTIHLHFNIRQNLAGQGWTYVPPYVALVDAYQRLLQGG